MEIGQQFAAFQSLYAGIGIKTDLHFVSNPLYVNMYHGRGFIGQFSVEVSNHTGVE
jgi:hypothetical protein